MQRTDTTRVELAQIAVLIPALNEELRIREVVQAALAQCPNVIVVDDGSSDDTVARIADLPVQLLRHPTRRGKGEALRCGFRAALARGYRGVVTMDGDGQHSAADVPRLLAAANRHPGSIVIGARLRKRTLQPTYRRLANEFGDWGIAWGTGYQLCDSQSGQRFYPAAVMALQEIPGEGFVFEAQVLVSAARQLGTRSVSVPIESRYRCADSAECFRASHFRPLHDLFGIVRHMLMQALRHGDLRGMYRSIRANPPIIDDPEGTLATPLVDHELSKPA